MPAHSTDMSVARGIIGTILRLILPLFYGWIILLEISYKFLKYGRKYFKCQVIEAPKQLFDEKLGKHGFSLLKNQGVRLHYVESGNRSKPLVILLHGFPDFWYSWRHQIPKLAENYWVVAVDMRGYGGSDCPSKLKSYIVKELVEDVKELVTTLGKNSAIVVGHDWGGIIGWYFCMAYPEIIKKLVVLNAPHPSAFQHVISKNLKQFFMSWYMFFFQLPYLPEFYLRINNLSFLRKCYSKTFMTDEEFESYKHTFSQPGALTPPINYYRANIKNLGEKRKKEEEKIAIPTLMIWGNQDFALSTDLVKASTKYCDNLKIEIVEGARHWVHHEEPNLVNNYIENFLKN